MSTEKLPVVAAIPNYNMSESLAALLEQAIAQEYDQIFVLDDASTDDSREIVEAFGPEVIFVPNDVNTGASGARNRIMGHLSKTSLIHFMDADIELVTKDMPEMIRKLHITDSTGFIGGLVINPDGHQSIWNYGPALSLPAAVSSWYVSGIKSTDKSGSGDAHGALYSLSVARPNPHETSLKRKKVFWALESSIVIRSDTFERLGGFDADVREHDIQALAIKAAQLGLNNYFDPSFVVKQQDVPGVRNYNRTLNMIKSEFHLTKKYHRLLPWFFPFLNK